MAMSLVVPASVLVPTRAAVLVVEDEVFIRLDVSEALRAAGFEVIEAESADNAFSLIEAREPLDVVFTDIQLPGMLDGLALANMIRAAHPLLPVVITSGNTAKRTEASRIGKFVPKPYQIGDVVKLITDIVETA
jgi:two-component system, response regulator PdtaR